MKIERYHIFISSSNKTILLSSSNSKKQVKKDALKKLSPNINNLLKKKIQLVKVKSTKRQKTQFIPRPFKLEIIDYLIEDPYTLINLRTKDTIYLKEKHLKKLKDIMFDYSHEKLNKGLLDVKIL